jgi:hypothetical protein
MDEKYHLFTLFLGVLAQKRGDELAVGAILDSLKEIGVPAANNKLPIITSNAASQCVAIGGQVADTGDWIINNAVDCLRAIDVAAFQNNLFEVVSGVVSHLAGIKDRANKENKEDIVSSISDAIRAINVNPT